MLLQRQIQEIKGRRKKDRPPWEEMVKSSRIESTSKKSEINV